MSLIAQEQLEVLSEAFGGAFHGLLFPLVYLMCAGISFLPVLKVVGAAWYLGLEKPELSVRDLPLRYASCLAFHCP